MTGRKYASRGRQQKSEQPRSKAEAGNRRDSQTESVSNPQVAQMLQLQRVVGNQGIQRLILQREDAPTPEAEKLLNPVQIADAIAWYKAQPARYTTDIISQIQAAVGTEPTGKMAEVDVLAVAQFQSTVPNDRLKIDGKAGPRTLPAVFRGGLADKDKISDYVGEAKEILDKWHTFKNGEERAKALGAKVAEYLAKSDVVPAKTVVNNAAGNLGQFDFTTWSLEIGAPAFNVADPTEEQKADMADTVYHESRHNEQWYRIAQMLAGRGKSAKQIAKEMTIPKEIADKAFAKPLKRGSMEFLIAEGWYDSVYGAGSDHREKTLKELPKIDADLEKAIEARKKAKQANDAAPTPENQKKLEEAQAKVVELRDKRQKAFLEYTQLPEENDAWRVGDEVTAKYFEKPQLKLEDLLKIFVPEGA